MIPEIRDYTQTLTQMQKVQLDGFDKAVESQADRAVDNFVVVVD